MNSPLVLIVSTSSSLRESLGDFLSAVAQPATLEAATPRSALEAIARRLPELIIIDAFNQPSDEVALVREIKSRWPQLRCLVLAKSPAQQLAAETSGADETLLWGLVRDQIADAVPRMLTAGQRAAD
jgi:DNA-binding NarL/FixJ family response regulator